MTTATDRPRTRSSRGSSTATSSATAPVIVPARSRRTGHCLVRAIGFMRAFEVGSSFRALHPHPRVVVRHAAGRVHPAAMDDDVSFRPVHLQVADRERGQENGTFVAAEIIDQRDAITLLEVQARGIVVT